MMDAPRSHRDSGAVLLLVLIVAIVLSLVVLALANFVAADLRYSQVVDARAVTLSTAESGIDFGVARLRANQTLCSTDAADGGPVGLNGALAPTVLPGALNEAVTTITCQRLPGTFAAVAGWSVIVTNGSQPDALKLRTDFDRRIHGPTYVSDVHNIDIYAPAADHLHVTNGDIWHRDGAACAAQLPPGDLATQVIFDEPQTRGPICTTANWNDIVTAPPVPTTLSSLPVNNGSTFTTITPSPGVSCRVFRPGHYTGAPQIPNSSTPRVYFESGDYYFDNVGEWLIDADARVTAGHPGSVSIPSDSCDVARAADPNTGGTGATFYLGGSSRLRLDDRGSLEMFARQHGDFFVNIQALSSADGYPASDPGADRSLIRTRPVNHVRLVVRGLVWSPASRVVLDNPHSSTVHQLLGGVVAEKLWIGDTGSGGTHAAADVVKPASAASDAFIKLLSTSTRDGVTTKVEAIVQYRPQATGIGADKRVAVNSSRVLD